MFTHDDLWRAIDRLADVHGYSPSGLAKKAGLDPTTFNKSKRVSVDGKPRWPSTESISKILSVTGATMSDFIALIGLDEKEQTGNPTIPMMNIAIAGKSGHFTSEGYPAGDHWDDFSFPEVATARNKHLYALEVNGNALTPVYREGDILVISPETNIRRGDRVVLRTTKGHILIQELRRQTASKVELKSLDATEETGSLSLEDISWMARIIWVSQ